MPVPAKTSHENDRALIARLLAYVRPYRGKLTGAALLLALVSLVEPLILLVFHRIVDRAFAKPVDAGANMPIAAQGKLAEGVLAPAVEWLDRFPVTWFPIFIVVMFSFRAICNFAGDVALHWVSSRVVFDVRVDTFKKMLRLPMRFFDLEDHL
jgi:ABC-type multidrug transport system fused ATPase/permease subunit